MKTCSQSLYEKRVITTLKMPICPLCPQIPAHGTRDRPHGPGANWSWATQAQDSGGEQNILLGRPNELSQHGIWIGNDQYPVSGY